MNFENYTTKAAESIQGMMNLANKKSQQILFPWHLAFVLLEQKGGIVNSILSKLEKSSEQILAVLGNNH